MILLEGLVENKIIHPRGLRWSKNFMSKEQIVNFISYLPFIGLMVQKKELLTTRIIEAVLITVITSIASSQLTLRSIETDMKWIKQYMAETRIEVNKLREKVYER